MDKKLLCNNLLDENLSGKKLMRYKTTILFDLDGTLTNPAEGITKSVSYALRHFGIHVEDLSELCKFIGPPLKESFMKFYGFDETKAKLAVEKYREYFSKKGIFENELIEGIDVLLKRLSESGRKLIVATSKPKVFADIILEHFGIIRYFNLVCGSELDGTRVCKDEVIRYALDLAGVRETGSVVMVGDREHDVKGALKVGIDCIGVLFGYGSREELQDAGATLIVENVRQLQYVLLGPDGTD